MLHSFNIIGTNLKNSTQPVVVTVPSAAAV